MMSVTLRDVQDMLHLCAAIATNATASERFTLAANTVHRARVLIRQLGEGGALNEDFYGNELLRMRGDD